MVEPTRHRTPFGQRLLEARKKAGLTQEQVKAALGMSQGTLSELEQTANGSSLTTQLANLYGADAHFLASGQDRAESPRQAAGLAHGVSYKPETVPLIEWGELMQTKELPPEFWIKLADDAMAPRAPKGKSLRFRRSTSRDFEKDGQFGQVVLFLAPDGKPHVRLLGQDISYGYQLRPTNANYASFVGNMAGMELLGVMTAIEDAGSLFV